MSKATFLVGGFPHMGKYSGYERLFSHLARKMPSHSIYSANRGIASLLHGKIKSALQITYGSQRNPYYEPSSIWSELRAYQRARLGRTNLIHFGYFENQYEFFSGRARVEKLKKRKVPIVATVHQPYSWWRYNDLFPLLDRLDRIIVLTQFDQDRLSEVLGDRVRYVPHGVDTEFFKPDQSKKDPNNMHCLFVGQWLRDFRVLAGVIENLTSTHRDIVFDLVLPSGKGDYAELSAVLRNRNVSLHRNISDEALVRLYQSSDLLFLPLFDCTANNAILESMSCGLPIVTTDIPGLGSYTRNSFADLLSGGAEDAITTILNYYGGDRTDLLTRGQRARTFAIDNFSWDKICLEVIDLYENTRNQERNK